MAAVSFTTKLHFLQPNKVFPLPLFHVNKAGERNIIPATRETTPNRTIAENWMVQSPQDIIPAA